MQALMEATAESVRITRMLIYNMERRNDESENESERESRPGGGREDILETLDSLRTLENLEHPEIAIIIDDMLGSRNGSPTPSPPRSASSTIEDSDMMQISTSAAYSGRAVLRQPLQTIARIEEYERAVLSASNQHMLDNILMHRDVSAPPHHSSNSVAHVLAELPPSRTVDKDFVVCIHSWSHWDMHSTANARAVEQILKASSSENSGRGRGSGVKLTDRFLLFRESTSESSKQEPPPPPSEDAYYESSDEGSSPKCMTLSPHWRENAATNPYAWLRIPTLVDRITYLHPEMISHFSHTTKVPLFPPPIIDGLTALYETNQLTLGDISDIQQSVTQTLPPSSLPCECVVCFGSAAGEEDGAAFVLCTLQPCGHRICAGCLTKSTDAIAKWHTHRYMSLVIDMFRSHMLDVVAKMLRENTFSAAKIMDLMPTTLDELDLRVPDVPRCPYGVCAMCRAVVRRVDTDTPAHAVMLEQLLSAADSTVHDARMNLYNADQSARAGVNQMRAVYRNSLHMYDQLKATMAKTTTHIIALRNVIDAHKFVLETLASKEVEAAMQNHLAYMNDMVAAMSSVEQKLRDFEQGDDSSDENDHNENDRDDDNNGLLDNHEPLHTPLPPATSRRGRRGRGGSRSGDNIELNRLVPYPTPPSWFVAAAAQRPTPYRPPQRRTVAPPPTPQPQRRLPPFLQQYASIPPPPTPHSSTDMFSGMDSRFVEMTRKLSLTRRRLRAYRSQLASSRRQLRLTVLANTLARNAPSPPPSPPEVHVPRCSCTCTIHSDLEATFERAATYVSSLPRLCQLEHAILNLRRSGPVHVEGLEEMSGAMDDTA